MSKARAIPQTSASVLSVRMPKASVATVSLSSIPIGNRTAAQLPNPRPLSSTAPSVKIITELSWCACTNSSISGQSNSNWTLTLKPDPNPYTDPNPNHTYCYQSTRHTTNSSHVTSWPFNFTQRVTSWPHGCDALTISGSSTWLQLTPN